MLIRYKYCMMFIKKYVFPTMFLLLYGISIFGNPVKTDEFTITMCNDAFGGELALCRDDYLSYGFGGNWRFDNGGFADLFFSGYTDRGNNLRTDEIMFKAGIEFPGNPKFGCFRFTPYIGGVLTGNVGGQPVQNLIHSIFCLKHVDLIYDEGRNGKAFNGEFLVGADTGYSFVLISDNQHSLEPKFDLKLEYCAPSGLMLDSVLSVNLENDSDDFFRIFAGRSDSFADFPGGTIDLALSREQGFYAGWGVQTGILAYNAAVYPATEYANGYISLFFSTAGKSVHDYKHCDFILDYTLDLLCFEKRMKLLFPVELNSDNADRLFSARLLPFIEYMYGDAIDDFYNTERQIRLIQPAAGLDIGFRPGFADIPLEFSAGISAGLRHEKYWNLGGPVEHRYGFMLHPQAGIRTDAIPLFPSSGIFGRNVLYGLSLGYGFQYMPSGMYVSYQHHVSIGLNLWCDY